MTALQVLQVHRYTTGAAQRLLRGTRSPKMQEKKVGEREMQK